MEGCFVIKVSSFPVPENVIKTQKRQLSYNLLSKQGNYISTLLRSKIPYLANLHFLMKWTTECWKVLYLFNE